MELLSENGNLKEMNRRELLKTSACCASVAFARHALIDVIPGVASVYPVAVTTTGRVRSFMDSEVCAFKGIPYGADTAPRRFMPPVPPVPWTGIREAIGFGPRAPQASGDGLHSRDVYITGSGNNFL
jgi:para-nitrobenzyl esterase